MKLALALLSFVVSSSSFAAGSVSLFSQEPMPARCAVRALKSGNSSEKTSALFDFKLVDIGYGAKSGKRAIQLSKSISLEITLVHTLLDASSESWQEFSLAAQMIESSHNGTKKVIAHFTEDANYTAKDKREIKATIYTPESSTFLLDKSMTVDNYRKLMVDMEAAGIEISGAQLTCFHW